MIYRLMLSVVRLAVPGRMVISVVRMASPGTREDAARAAVPPMNVRLETVLV